MAKKSTFKSNWPKYLLQWGVLALLVFFLSGLASLVFTDMNAPDPEKYCPFGGLEALGTYFANGSLPCSMTSMQIAMGVVLAAAVVLLGKLFCGYLCPVGTVEDLLKKLRQAIGFNAFNINERSVADKVLRIVKYVLLFITFYMTLTASELFCKNFDPYYATATGFKGEITLWMSVAALALVLIPGLCGQVLVQVHLPARSDLQLPQILGVDGRACGCVVDSWPSRTTAALGLAAWSHVSARLPAGDPLRKAKAAAARRGYRQRQMQRQLPSLPEELSL